eukprot:403359292
METDSQSQYQEHDQLDKTIAQLQQEMGVDSQQFQFKQLGKIQTDNRILLKSLELQDTNLIKEVNEQQNQARHHTTIRGRDKSVAIPKRKKKLMIDAYGDDQTVTQYSSTGRQGGIGQSLKRSSVSSRRSKNYTSNNDQSSQMRTQSPMHIRKSVKQRKNLLQTFGQNNYQLQEVGVFKSFLLQNDSQYIDYVNNDLILNLLDSQMMKESMISFMAQMMGNGQSKDNFFLKTRSAIQDTLGLFFISKNISQNNSVEFYLPRLIEMISDLLDVERCSIYLYDKLKDEIYCKVITGKMKDPISFPRLAQNVLCQVFNTGQSVYVKNIVNEPQTEEITQYLQIDHKLHQATRNFMIIPIKLGNNAVGCFELANKKGTQDFTDHDMSIIQQISDEIAGGLISYEMKHNIKKEFDMEVKHVKGLMGEIYQQTLIPLVNDLINTLKQLLNAEKVVIFMHNKDIDHLYSFSTTQDQQQFNPLQSSNFGIETIRMKSTIGLAGKAFTSQQICKDTESGSFKLLTQDEKDLNKLKLEMVRNALSIPVLEKQNNTPQCVLQVYNYDTTIAISDQLLWGFSAFVASVMFNVDLQQGTMLTQDILEAQFDLVNDGVVILNSMGLVTKVNKSTEIMFNQQSLNMVGKHISELLTPSNNHLFHTFNEQVFLYLKLKFRLLLTNIFLF